MDAERPQRAVEAVLEGALSYRAAASAYGASITSIHERLTRALVSTWNYLASDVSFLVGRVGRAELFCQGKFGCLDEQV